MGITIEVKDRLGSVLIYENANIMRIYDRIEGTVSGKTPFAIEITLDTKEKITFTLSNIIYYKIQEKYNQC